MSVYSGFGTRLQETAYDKLIEGLIQLLTIRVLSTFRREVIDEVAWIKQFGSVYRKLWKLELHKYQPPKLTWACKDLADVLGCSASIASSNSSSQQGFARKGRTLYIRDLGETIADEALELIKEVPLTQESVFDSDSWVRRHATPPPPKQKSSSSPYIRKSVKEKKPRSIRAHLLGTERRDGQGRRKGKFVGDSSLLS